MRVALVNVTTTTQFGGVETFVLELANALRAAGDEVVVFGGQKRYSKGQAAWSINDVPQPASAITMDDGTTAVYIAGTGKDGSAIIRGRDIVTTPFVSRDIFRSVPLLSRQYGLTKLLERLTYAPLAYSAIAEGRFDIVHIHKPFDFPLAAALVHARTGVKAKAVYSSHGRDFWRGDHAFIGAIAAITACSEYNAAEVQEQYHREATVIYNGVNLDLFRPSAPDYPLWQQAYTVGQQAESFIGPGDAPLLVWSGRLVRWKGTIDAIRALVLMRTHTHLLIAGSGPEEQRLREAARALGIADRVHFGQYPHAQMPEVYAMADLALGTSFANETFGMALAEASACERAVVATDFGGFREVVRHGETGLLVSPRDPAALAAACDALLADPAGRAALGAAGRRFVSERFAWPIVAARVQAVYQSVL